MLSEGELAGQDLGNALDEGEAFAFEKRRWSVLHVQFFELRLVIEQLQLRRRTGHVQVDHSLGLRRDHRRLGSQRADGGRSVTAIAADQLLQRDRAQAQTAVAKEVPPRQ